MATFILTLGIDTFTGNAGEDNFFSFTPSTLQSTDTITGGATGGFQDHLVITAAGAFTANQFDGVTNVEHLILSRTGGSTVALKNSIVAGTSFGGTFIVEDGAGNGTVDAKGSTMASGSVRASGGTDIQGR